MVHLKFFYFIYVVRISPGGISHVGKLRGILSISDFHYLKNKENCLTLNIFMNMSI